MMFAGDTSTRIIQEMLKATHRLLTRKIAGVRSVTMPVLIKYLDKYSNIRVSKTFTVEDFQVIFNKFTLGIVEALTTNKVIFSPREFADLVLKVKRKVFDIIEGGRYQL